VLLNQQGIGKDDIGVAAVQGEVFCQSNAQVLKQNVRKRSKTFENIRKHSKNGVKHSKLFENTQLF
jgi:hypothetical protein